MSQYSLTFLLNEEAELKVLKELIATLGGVIKKEEKWGEKTLAYSIKNIRSAHYYQWQMEIEKNKILELKKKLNYNEKLIRYLLLAVEK